MALDKTAQIIKDVFEDHLFTTPHNFQEVETLPSPSELIKKVLIMANVNIKLLKGNPSAD